MPDEISPDGIPTSSKTQEIPLSRAGEGAPAPESKVEVETPESVQEGEETPPVEAEVSPEIQPKEDKTPESTKQKIEVDEDDGEAINFNDFLKKAGKESEIKKDEPVPTTEKTPVTAVPAAGAKDPNARDYTGIDEKDVPHFKRMPNEAFNALKPVYLENKKLKEDFTKLETEHKTLKEKGPQLPESYFESPQGYLLDPEFQETVGDFQTAQGIAAHWNKQYELVAEGAREFDMLDFNSQTGQFEITGKIPATAGSEAKLLMYVNHAQTQLAEQHAKVKMLQKQHSAKATEGVRTINEMSSQFFNDFYKTPENKAIYEPLVKNVINSFPPAFRNSPLAKFAAESFVMNQALARLVKQHVDEKAQAVAIKKNPPKPKIPNNRLNPTAGEATSDGGKGGSENGEVTFDDFQKAKGM